VVSDSTAAFFRNLLVQGQRELPARTIPVPDTVSPVTQKLIAAPLPAGWSVSPKTAEERKAQVNAAAARRSFDDRKHSQDCIKTGTSR
jgi:hypothetical protein